MLDHCFYGYCFYGYRSTGWTCTAEPEHSLSVSGLGTQSVKRSATGRRSRVTGVPKACRAVKSNAILLAKDGASVGVGMGQVNRVDSAKLAVERAGAERAAGSFAASDAFFPFPDGLEILTGAGVRAVVQPGGSVRDEQVVEAANKAGVTMYFTGDAALLPLSATPSGDPTCPCPGRPDGRPGHGHVASRVHDRPHHPVPGRRADQQERRDQQECRGRAEAQGPDRGPGRHPVRPPARERLPGYPPGSAAVAATVEPAAGPVAARSSAAGLTTSPVVSPMNVGVVPPQGCAHTVPGAPAARYLGCPGSLPGRRRDSLR
ncbi:Bifunctional purine biosynthesis protein PurH [Streptomyces hirsutus]